MTVWGWIVVAATAFAGLSIVAGLVIARILGSISAGPNQILENEGWTSAPLTRDTEQSEAPRIGFGGRAPDRRSRSSRS
jgi:hypothetical protein